MKRTIIYIIGILISLTCYAQTISIKALVVDEKIPEEAARNLENKLQAALSQSGLADNGYVERFVLTAKVDITQKDIMPTTPTRISEKIDITLMVGDVVENKLYASTTLQVAGIGTNENKAFINAFQNIKGNNPRIKQLIDNSKGKIYEFYNDHCNEIIIKSERLASQQSYDEAIALVITVPNVCNECFEICQKKVGEIYQQKIDSEKQKLLELAKTAWATSQDSQGAMKAADYISKINPFASSYDEVIQLRDAISSKLQDDEKRDWDFKMKEYEDSQLFKRDIVDAVKAIGTAWGQNQPKTINKTIIKSWW